MQDVIVALDRVPGKQAPAVVLGAGSNGLAFVRSLGRHGIPVAAVDVWKRAGMFSRFAASLRSPDPIHDREQLLEFLVRLGRSLRWKPVLIPTTDAFALVVSMFHSELQDFYDFNVADHDTALSLTNKRQQYELAQKQGILTPWTFYPADMPIEEISERATYPCLVKPYSSHIWWSHMAATSTRHWGKLVEVRSPAELVSTYNRLSESRVDFMVQEKVAGGDDCLYGLLTYFNRSSEPLAIFTKRKLRQYPRYFGNGSIQVSVQDPEAAEAGLKFLRALKYRGIAGVEFKRDSRDGLMRLIEVNPRSISQTSHAVACGIDIPYIAYRDSMGDPVRGADTFRAGVKWISFDRDWKAFQEYRRSGDLDLGSWLRSCQGDRCFAFLSRDDPLPFVVGFWLFLRGEVRARLSRIRLDSNLD